MTEGKEACPYCSGRMAGLGGDCYERIKKAVLHEMG